MRIALSLCAVLSLVACKAKSEPQPRTQEGVGSGSGSAGSAAVAPATARYDALPRPDFNRWAVRANLPVYWIADADEDKVIDADEVAALLFYPSPGAWVADGRLAPEFAAAYQTIVAASQAPPPDAKTEEGKRQLLVG